ncbi:hypothetical protein BC567DRAFT_262899 [Phyllosticta citribraziliensis]
MTERTKKLAARYQAQIKRAKDALQALRNIEKKIDNLVHTIKDGDELDDVLRSIAKKTAMKGISTKVSQKLVLGAKASAVSSKPEPMLDTPKKVSGNSHASGSLSTPRPVTSGPVRTPTSREMRNSAQYDLLMNIFGASKDHPPGKKRSVGDLSLPSAKKSKK